MAEREHSLSRRLLRSVAFVYTLCFDMLRCGLFAPTFTVPPHATLLLLLHVVLRYELRNATLYDVVLCVCFAGLRYDTLWYAMIRSATLCHAMIRYKTLYYVMSCNMLQRGKNVTRT